MKSSRSLSYSSKRLGLIALFAFLPAVSVGQPFVNYNKLPLFMSGANVAWVSFAADIGPGTTNFNAFRTMFDSVHASGGNIMRLWLHTTGASTPAFNSNGIVTGPGNGAISDLQQILDLAWERRVGLMLCLWSFDMLRQSNGSTINNRAMTMLTDSSALAAYIQNALIPMVTAVKGHPGIVSWEVFNEAEGMSNEYGWDGILRVPMLDIQIFVNRVAGAIHRTDPDAKVTTGAWAFIALSDVTIPSKVADLQSRLLSMSQEEKTRIEDQFTARYGLTLPADQILSHYSVASNKNYYRDDRLIAAGRDQQGTLDFYTVHYYDWAGTALSPFHHKYSEWKLDKPLIVAEFFAQTTFGVSQQDLYRVLMQTGYAGALTWQWIDNTQQARTKTLMRDLYSQYRADLEVEQIPGTIYSFNASPPQVHPGQSTTLSWTTAAGSNVTFNGVPCAARGDTTVTPSGTTDYTLAAIGSVSNTATVTVTTVVTAAPAAQAPRPTQYALLQNYPNPFNPSTTIGFTLPAKSEVRIAVFNLLGQEIARLVDEHLDAGRHSMTWNARVGSGVYFCRMHATADEGSPAAYDKIIKMTVIR